RAARGSTAGRRRPRVGHAGACRPGLALAGVSAGASLTPCRRASIRRMLRGVVIDVRWPQAVQHVQEAIDGHEPVVTLEGHGRALTSLLYPSLEQRMRTAERLLSVGGYELALRTYGHDSETFRHRDAPRIDVAPVVDSRGRR